MRFALLLVLAACLSARQKDQLRNQPGEYLHETQVEKWDPTVSSSEGLRRDYAYDEARAEAARIDAGYYDSEPCPTSTNPHFSDGDAAEKRRLQVLCRRRGELIDAGVLTP